MMTAAFAHSNLIELVWPQAAQLSIRFIGMICNVAPVESVEDRKRREKSLAGIESMASCLQECAQLLSYSHFMAADRI